MSKPIEAVGNAFASAWNAIAVRPILAPTEKALGRAVTPSGTGGVQSALSQLTQATQGNAPVPAPPPTQSPNSRPSGATNTGEAPISFIAMAHGAPQVGAAQSGKTLLGQ